jgi:phosphoglycolate phosphatase-like HAD superfamily hydrolase
MALKTRNEGRLLVLDVDGVMIDPRGSFETCAGAAIREAAPGLAWSDELYRRFKRLPGFNNDFRMCAAALALFEAGGMGGIEEALRSARPLPPGVEERIRETEPRCKERVQFHYRGVAHLERPLVTLPELEALEGWDVAILTGRPPEEMALAFGVLGFELPAACDSRPEFRKPAPGGLLHLADRFGAGSVHFVGDTIDDATCLARARERRPGLALTFVAVGGLRHEIAGPGDLAFPTLREFLADLSGHRSTARGPAAGRPAGGELL